MKKQYKHKHLEGWETVDYDGINGYYTIVAGNKRFNMPLQLIEGNPEWVEVVEPVEEEYSTELIVTVKADKEYIESLIWVIKDHNKVQSVGERKSDTSDESVHAHSEPVLMTTEDGTRLYKGSAAILYRLNVNDWTTAELERCPECISYDTHNYKYWISEEHMKEYIEYHRPMLSQKEIVEEVMPQALIMTSPLAEKLKCVLDSYIIEKLQNNK